MNRKFAFLPVVFSLIAVLSSCFMAPSSDDSGAVRIALPVVQGVNASVYGSRADVPAGSETFIIEVVDTQDSTWQGRVSWVNGQKQQTFRSVMELLRLVDSVVGENEKGFIERKTF